MTTINQDVVDRMRERYSHVHPLMFQRSLERSTTPGELFDILEAIPAFPIVWDEASRGWSTSDDMLQIKAFR